MCNKLKLFNEAFEDGTLAFSDRILPLIDDDLLEDDIDTDLEAALASENV